MIFKKQINKQYNHTFNIDKSGLVAVFVSARCRCKKQIRSNIDEDLRIEINGMKFREIPPQKYIQVFNIPAAWNGSDLRGLKKTIVFLTVLNKGDHIVSLIPKNSAFIEEIKVQELSGKQDVYLEIEEQAEDGDRRPWYTFVLVDLALKEFSADVTVKWRGLDSDDVKLIINGEIKKNNLSILHRYWLWSANIFRKLLRRERQTKSFQEDLSKSIHCIEFWADRMPILHEITLNLGKIEMPQGEEAKVVWSTTHLRKECKIEKDNILVENIERGEEVRVLEKAIKGERPRNEKGKLLNSNRWHKVQYKNQEGYIYSEALEIDSESKEKVQKIIIEKAKAEELDPEILLALAECESHFFPYTVSFDEIRPEIAFGVMQLTPILIKDLNDSQKPFYSPVKDIFNLEQNIKGGISYFKWLYQERYKKSKNRLDRSVAAYNAGPSKVPVDKPLDLDSQDSETQRLVNCVKKHLRKKTFEKILSVFKKTILVLIILSIGLFSWEEFVGPGVGFLIQARVLPSEERRAISPDQVSHFPVVLWQEESNRLLFFNSQEKLVKEIPAERLDLNRIFQVPLDVQEWDSIHLEEDMIEYPEGTFYFLVATTWSCGINCTWVFYRYNVEQDILEIIDEDISGIDVALYPSPDFRNLALVRYVHGSVCDVGGYLKVIDLENFKRKEIKGFEDDLYPTTSIKFLGWEDKDNIKIKTFHTDCSNLWKKDHQRVFQYNLNTREIKMLQDITVPES